MESPLDILSRAAGMVSRSCGIDSSNSAQGLKSGNSGRHILKLNVEDETSSRSDDSSLNLSSSQSAGGRNVLSAPKRPSPDNDSDTPLDMSIKKPKRKSSSSEGEEMSMLEHTVKRKRPSVISYASHQAISMAGLDVDDHFKKSLGLDFYNSVFSNSNGKNEDSTEEKDKNSANEDHRSNDGCDVATTTPTNPASSSVQHQSAHLENTVDDHFVKALGKSTWMRLRQGL